MQISQHFRLFALALSALTCLAPFLTAAEYKGTVKYGGLPLPGATVTATQGDKKLIAVTDPQGAYSFADMADGAWNIQVEMLCFETIKQDVTLAGGAPAGDWTLKLLSFDQIKATAVEAPPPPPPTPTTSVTPQLTPAQMAANEKNDQESPATRRTRRTGRRLTPANGPGGFQRTQANATARLLLPMLTPPPASDSPAGKARQMRAMDSWSTGLHQQFSDSRRSPWRRPSATAGAADGRCTTATSASSSTTRHSMRAHIRNRSGH